jgi:DNA ligase (NAD+)
MDDLDDRSVIGATNKSPRWAIAYKFAPEQAQTVIESICVQVGRTGVLTPVANLKPVLLSGSTISRATLHNQDEISRKDIREGDLVIIEKGGDVIPKVVSVIIVPGKHRQPKWSFPTQCPYCASEVIQKEGQVALRCKAGEKCSGQYIARMKHFVSKGAMNIENMGIKVIEKLYGLGLLDDLPSIYRLRPIDLEGVEGFKQRSIQALIENIETSKEVELARFIFALGIPFVGIVAAKVIADRVKDVQGLLAVSYEELIQLEGVGEKVASSIVEFVRNSSHIDEIKEFMRLGIHTKTILEKVQGHEFSGKSFVVTGTLEEFDRTQAKEAIESCGGKVSSSLSKLTDYLLLGKNPGSKYNKALKLNIKILTESDFKGKL